MTVAEKNPLSDGQFQVVTPVCSSANSASVLSSISRSLVDPLMYAAIGPCHSRRLQVPGADPADLLHAIDLQPHLAPVFAQQDHSRGSPSSSRLHTQKAPQIDHRPNLAMHIDDSRKHRGRSGNRRGRGPAAKPPPRPEDRSRSAPFRSPDTITGKASCAGSGGNRALRRADGPARAIPPPSALAALMLRSNSSRCILASSFSPVTVTPGPAVTIARSGIASQHFQDIPEGPRRRAGLPPSFQSQTEMIVSQREISGPGRWPGAAIAPLVQRSRGFRKSAPDRNGPRRFNPFRVSNCLTILGRALPIAVIGQLAQAIQICRNYPSGPAGDSLKGAGAAQ